MFQSQFNSTDDPFAKSFGSLSISSNEATTNWAHFDDASTTNTTTKNFDQNSSSQNNIDFPEDPFASSLSNASPSIIMVMTLSQSSYYLLIYYNFSLLRWATVSINLQAMKNLNHQTEFKRMNNTMNLIAVSQVNKVKTLLHLEIGN